MKKIFLILCLLLFPIGITFSQEGWYQVNPNPQLLNAFNGVCFTSYNTAIAVGFSGTIMKTTDGGDSWVNQISGTTMPLYSVCFSDSNNGIVVGSFGTILKTTDAGINWTHQQSGTNDQLNRVTYIGANTYVAVGNTGLALRSTNGGINWTNSSFNVYVWQNLYGVFFVNSNVGTLVGDDVVFKTTNGGVNWIKQSLPNTTGTALRDVHFSDINTGTAVGNTKVFRTTNGGEDWIVQFSMNRYFSGVYFFDANIGIIFGNGGTLLRTIDGGNTWIDNSLVAPFGFSDVSFIDSINGLLVGGSNNDVEVFKTTNGGISWQNKSGIKAGLKAVCFNDSSTGTAVGEYGTIIKTTNGGASWVSQLSCTSQYLIGVDFIDSNVGIVVGSFGTILKTTDGGNSWSNRISGTISNLNEVLFVDSNNGFIIGGDGIILKTTDSGETWFSIQSGTTNHLIGVSFSDSIYGTIVGSGGIILRTTDGGSNWFTQYSSLNTIISGVFFNNQNVGTAVGYLGIIHTTDGGVTWVDQAAIEYLKNICFSDSNSAYVVGHGSWVIRTSDQGQNWYIHDFMYYRNFKDVFFVNENIGYIVGEYGIILKTIDGGGLIVPVELTSFTGDISYNKVSLEWSTATELNNRGFEIERSIDKINWRIIGFKEGNGTTAEPQQYSYSDNISDITSSKLYYRLKQIDFNGSFEYSEVVEVEIAPTSFSLEQNYPNPFNPSTKISWQSPVGSWQTLKVYDVLGNEVATLVNEYREVGNYEVEFNLESSIQNLPAGRQGTASGIYFYQLKAGEFVETKKMILIK